MGGPAHAGHKPMRPSCVQLPCYIREINNATQRRRELGLMVYRASATARRSAPGVENDHRPTALFRASICCPDVIITDGHSAARGPRQMLKTMHESIRSALDMSSIGTPVPVCP
jgi:hypothetical protein